MGEVKCRIMRAGIGKKERQCLRSKAQPHGLSVKFGRRPPSLRTCFVPGVFPNKTMATFSKGLLLRSAKCVSRRYTETGISACALMHRHTETGFSPCVRRCTDTLKQVSPHARTHTPIHRSTENGFSAGTRRYADTPIHENRLGCMK